MIEARKENSTKRDVIFFGPDAIKLLIGKNNLFTKDTIEKLENLNEPLLNYKHTLFYVRTFKNTFRFEYDKRQPNDAKQPLLIIDELHDKHDIPTYVKLTRKSFHKLNNTYSNYIDNRVCTFKRVRYMARREH